MGWSATTLKSSNFASRRSLSRKLTLISMGNSKNGAQSDAGAILGAAALHCNISVIFTSVVAYRRREKGDEKRDDYLLALPDRPDSVLAEKRKKWTDLFAPLAVAAIWRSRRRQRDDKGDE